MMRIRQINASDTWKIRHEVMWPYQPFEFVKLEDDDSGIHFGVFIEEKLVSIVSCFITDDEMQFRKMATLQDFQGQGSASTLLGYIMQLAKEKKLKRVWCNARTNKKSFYERFEMKDTFQTFNKLDQEFTIMEACF